jgi:hypothetical protein
LAGEGLLADKLAWITGIFNRATRRSGRIIDVDCHPEGRGLNLAGVDGDCGVATYD